MSKLMSALLALALMGCAATSRTAPDFLPPAAVRADLTALYEGLQRAHYNLYANTPRAAYDDLYEDMLASIDAPMSRLDAHVLLQRFAAAGRVAHATLGFPSEAYETFRVAAGRVFPLGVQIEADRLYVSQNLSGLDAIAAGQEILSIDGESVTTLLARLGRNVSADNDYLLHAQLAPQFAALLWLERGEVDAFRVELRQPDGATATLSLQARTRTEMRAAAAELPPTLEIDYTERVARTMPDGVAYLRPGIFLNVESDDLYNTDSFRAFIDTSFARFLEAGASTLLIDLRDNPGGDNTFSDPMIAWFADELFRFASAFRIRVSAEATAANAARIGDTAGDSVSHELAAAYANASNGDVIDFPIEISQPRAERRFEGRVFVLINRRSFSNSVLTAAIVQDYGFGRVIGEPTSDLATTYGAMEHFTLPNTGLSVGFPKAHIVRPSGDARVQGVTPDVLIATPIVQATDDPVLQEALRIFSRR
ncbi:MAG: S41 family peptidase [Terricaulis sp.]